MSGISSIFARTTSLMNGDALLSSLRQTQRELLDVQRQMSTLKRYSRPSDAPDKTSAILLLQQRLAAGKQHTRNLEHSLGMLNNADAALGEANNILLEAKTVAMSQIGVGSDAETRKLQSLLVDAQLEAMIDLANREAGGIPLFAGRAGGTGGPAFEAFLGGVRYTGSTDNLHADVGTLAGQRFTSNGADAFGSLSARVASKVDLNPQASDDTAIADVAGATLEGVRLGAVDVTVNGTRVRVDLTTADTLGDVRTRINAAIDSVAIGAGSLVLNGGGFELTSTAGNTVTLSEVGSGKTASDLGVQLSAAGGASDVGPSVQRRLSASTRLADFGAAIDFASGLSITQGEQTKIADFSSAQTVQDMINVVDSLNLGLRLQINAAGMGVDLISDVSGINLSIGENGGTTAADLGLRSYGLDTQLADFRHGLGVENIEGQPDFVITTHDNTAITIDLDGVRTVGELITAINIAGGGKVTASLATVGNGLVLQDTTVGPEAFRVEGIGESVAADHLGLRQNVGAAATLTGSDEATVRIDSVFTHLIDLRDALTNNDERGITLAGNRIESDLTTLTQARASVGIEAKRVENEQTRAQDRELAEQTMLSNLQDVDLAEAVTRLGQLQTQMQMALQVGAQNMQMSLLDFLR